MNRHACIATRSSVADPAMSRVRAGFTLIKLLTVIAIIGVLAAILIPTIGACRQQAKKSREVSAARQLMVAYHLAADENRGRLIPHQDLAATGTTNEHGQIITDIAGMRWPHRIRPYLGNRFRATLYVNEQADYYDETAATSDYTLSLGTTFGLNGPFVGGDASSLIKDRPVQSVAQAATPARLIAFASAHYRTLNPRAGYWRIGSPSAGWPSANLAGVPAAIAQDAAYGWLAYRWDGRATVAYLDGHVALQSCAELRDMRLWSDIARRTDNPDYVPAQ